MVQTNYLYDSGWVMKAAGLIGASAAVATVIDTGSATANVKGEIIIDITAIEIDTSNEIYDIVLQGTNTAAFATDTDIVDLCSMTFADDAVQRTDCNRVSTIGRYIMRFTNEYNGTCYRYLRLYTIVAGTIGSGGINYSAYASIDK